MAHSSTASLLLSSNNNNSNSNNNNNSKVNSSPFSIELMYPLTQVLKQIHPSLTISIKTVEALRSLLNLLARLVAQTAAQYAEERLETKTFITASGIQNAVRTVIEGELAKHAVSEGTKAVTKIVSKLGTLPDIQDDNLTHPIYSQLEAEYNTFQIDRFRVMLTPLQPAPTVANSSSYVITTNPTNLKTIEGDYLIDCDGLRALESLASPLAGLVFPIGSIYAFMTNLLPGFKISPLAATYLTACLEYISAELLELSGNQCRDDRAAAIYIYHLNNAIIADDELLAMCKRFDERALVGEFQFQYLMISKDVEGDFSMEDADDS